MNEYFTIAFNLLGGLALFLFGMDAMSDSLQKAAGDRMKQILGFLTRNPVMGVIAGCLVTCVIQSSSATTVMVVGFVTAGLMTMRQGISVALGASIGTTITAQIVAFKISDFIMPIIFIGFIIWFIFKKESIKNTGMVIMSFGILFLGIELMGDAMLPLAQSDAFLDMIQQVKDIPILGFMVGLVMTLIIQSSSATVAILQSLASTPGPDGQATLTLTQSLPVLYGDNIGTTITALIACLSGSRDSKRVAIAHTIFKTIGSIIFMFLIPIYAPIIEATCQGESVAVISRQIANAHTIFNVINTCFWLPLIGVLEKIVLWIVPRKPEESRGGEIIPHFLNTSVLNQPVAAMHLLSQELERTGHLVGDMLADVKVALIGPGRAKTIEEVKEQAREISELNSQIASYIAAMMSGSAITEAQSERCSSLLSINNDIKRVSDRCEEIAELAAKQPNGKMEFSKAGTREVEEIMGLITPAYNNVITALVENDKGLAETVVTDVSKFHRLVKKSNKNHLKRWKDRECDESLRQAYPDVLASLQRIGDNTLSLSEEVLSDTELGFIELAQSTKVASASEEVKTEATPAPKQKK